MAVADQLELMLKAGEGIKLGILTLTLILLLIKQSKWVIYSSRMSHCLSMVSKS